MKIPDPHMQTDDRDEGFYNENRVNRWGQPQDVDEIIKYLKEQETEKC